MTAQQLKEPRYSGCITATRSASRGSSTSTTASCAASPGTDRVQVDALGRPTGSSPARRPSAGDDVRLTIDSSLQATGRARSTPSACPGAFVAMNAQRRRGPRDGLGTDLRPLDLHPPDHTEHSTASSPRSRTDAPLANRAIQGLYPTGSTFKPITATAALQDHLIGAEHDLQRHRLAEDRQQPDAAQRRQCDLWAGRHERRTQGLLRHLLLQPRPEGQGVEGRRQIQDWARQYGLGEKTGIDLPAEVDGLIPTPAWRNRLYRPRTSPTGPGARATTSTWRWARATSRPTRCRWRSPTRRSERRDVLTPHIGDDVESVTGRVIEEIRPAPRRHIDIAQTTRDTIMTGLTRAAMEPGGTSYPVFGQFPVRGGGQDRYRPATEPAGSVLVHRPRAREEPPDRGCRDARARGLRRRHRSAGGRADPGALLPSADHAHGDGPPQERPTQE